MMTAPADLPEIQPANPRRDSDEANTGPTSAPRQIRLRTLLLAIGVVAVPLMAMHYRWIKPLTMFPFLYVAGVAGGMAAASVLQPTRAWARVIGGMLGSALATTLVIFAAFAVEVRELTSFAPAIRFSAMMFVPAIVSGGATCLCWEAFFQRHSTFLPGLGKLFKR